MYSKFFGFEKNPFATRPDGAFFFQSKQHDAALNGLTFAVRARMGLISLIGEQSCGKTTILEWVYDSLEANNIHCAFLREPRLSVNRFFANLVTQLDLRCQEGSPEQILSTLCKLAIKQAQRGRTMAVLVDDAHELPPDVFNEILRLGSLHNKGTKLLQVVLAGPPALSLTLDTLNLERLNQRAILSFALRPFEAQETKEYIEFRLAKAGVPDQTIFSRQAFAEIQHRSHGIPPAIHALCERLLSAALSAGSNVVTPEILDQVFQGDPHETQQTSDQALAVVRVPRIDVVGLAISFAPEPPLRLSPLPLFFASRPGLPPPAPAILQETVVLGPGFPVWSSELPLAGSAMGLGKPLRIFIPAAECLSHASRLSKRVSSRGVSRQTAILPSPIEPVAAAEPVLSSRAILKQNEELAWACSIPAGPRPRRARTIQDAGAYIPPPLKAYCPDSELDPINPRSSFRFLSTGTLPEAIRVPIPNLPGKWLRNVAIILLAVFTFYIAPPAFAIASDAAQRGWRATHQAVLNRASVALDDDFRSGLDDWMNRGGARPSWTSDAAGFVHPGSLALYRPSLSLTDYQMQFVGTIEKKGLSWVVRAADFNNYYALRLTVLKPGPVPTIGVTRYAVVNGKDQKPVTTQLLMSARSDTVYRVHLDVHGDRFALTVQDQLVDSWSDPKLRRGGIGFFSEPDELSRVSGVRVRGQYDMLGRLCAFLLPSGTSAYRVQLNELAAVAVTAEGRAGGGGRGGPYAFSPDRTNRLDRNAAQLGAPAWSTPDLALSRRIHCPSPARPVGLVKARRPLRRSGTSAFDNCYE